MSHEGNIVGKIEKKPTPRFEPGDVVALTQAALRMPKLKTMVPYQLWKIGHPNAFLVVHTFDDEERGQCVGLYPCCTRFTNHDTEKPRCTGHPTEFFQKVDRKRVPKKGDRTTSVYLPFIDGEVGGIQYCEDEDNPSIKVNVGGIKAGVDGVVAKGIKDLFSSIGLL